MPDFYDDMYEAGFDDPADYMGFIENDSPREGYYDGVSSEYSECDIPRFAYQQHVNFPRFQELEQKYLAWMKKDPRGELFDDSIVKFHETISFLYDEEDFLALLKKLESWELWLDLSSDNEIKFRTTQMKPLLDKVDSILRTKAICLTIKDACTYSRDSVGDFDVYKSISNWLNSNPSYYQQFISGINSANSPCTVDTCIADAIIWSDHFYKGRNLFFLFKCNKGIGFDEWDECFNQFINNGGISRMVFDAWKDDNRLIWENYLKQDDTLLIRHSLQEDIEAKEEDFWWFRDSLLDENDSSLLSQLTIWDEDSKDDYIDQRLFFRWRDMHMDEWKCWAEKYVWEKDLGHFKSGFTSKYSYLPYQWVDKMIIDASCSWIDSHRAEWEHYLQQIDYSNTTEAINQISVVYTFALKYYKQLDSIDLLLQLGDFLRHASPKWGMDEQVNYQYIKEGAMNNETRYRDEEWWRFVLETKESTPNATFSEILNAWEKRDGLLSDYYTRCIYMHWLTVLANNGKIDSKLQFENVAGFY